MRKVAIPAVVVAAGIIGWLAWQQTLQQSFVVSGFLEADQIRVGSRVGGRVADVSAREGDRVPAGASLFEIQAYDLAERLAEAQAVLAARQAEHRRLTAGFRKPEIEQARAKRDAAKAALDRLIAGPRPQEIDIARENLNRAKADLALAESEHARLVRLKEQEQAAPTEFDRAIRGLRSAQAQVAAAAKQLELLTEGTRKEDIAEARAILAEASQALALLEQGFREEDIAAAAAQAAAAAARVAAIRVQLDELTVRSPCDCVVETIDLRSGDLVSANAPSVSLLDLSSLWVRAYVPEDRLGVVRLGQSVPIVVDSFPGERFTGRITFISQEAEFTPRNVQTPEERSKQVFRIKVTLDAEGRDRLRVGMGADVLLGEAIGP